MQPVSERKRERQYRRSGSRFSNEATVVEFDFDEFASVRAALAFREFLYGRERLLCLGMCSMPAEGAPWSIVP